MYRGEVAPRNPLSESIVRREEVTPPRRPITFKNQFERQAVAHNSDKRVTCMPEKAMARMQDYKQETNGNKENQDPVGPKHFRQAILDRGATGYTHYLENMPIPGVDIAGRRPTIVIRLSESRDLADMVNRRRQQPPTPLTPDKQSVPTFGIKWPSEICKPKKDVIK